MQSTHVKKKMFSNVGHVPNTEKGVLARCSLLCSLCSSLVNLLSLVVVLLLSLIIIIVARRSTHESFNVDSSDHIPLDIVYICVYRYATWYV